ncbi:MAG TPA: carboxypeptidase-like regulatory domain-containing protein [Bacteroidales bacterium]|nr:carboxypeptidase-like regulatory domain-containing protein [Bacteroidales bacterium]
MKVIKLILLTNILIFLSGCNKEENTFLKGNIVGFVRLVDQHGNEVIDKSGVNITIEGLDNSVTSEANGRFELSGVPAGTYNLTFEKTGYGTHKKFSYQFIGGNMPAVLPETELYELPDIEILSLEVTNNKNSITVSVTIPATIEFSVQSFINDSSTVSNLNYDFASNIHGNCCIPVTQFNQNITLDETAYNPGKKVYMAVYFINPKEDYGYYDPESEETVITSYKKASSVIELILE